MALPRNSLQFVATRLIAKRSTCTSFISTQLIPRIDDRVFAFFVLLTKVLPFPLPMCFLKVPVSPDD